MARPRLAPFLTLLAATTFATHTQGAPTQPHEVIDTGNGCADSNAHVVDAPAADQGFVCECNDGFVDLDDSGDADCTEEWSGFDDGFLFNICVIAPYICQPPTPPPPAPDPPEEEEGSCMEECLAETLSCLNAIDDSDLDACTRQAEAELSSCIAEAQEECFGVLDFSGCFEPLGAFCTSHFGDVIDACEGEHEINECYDRYDACEDSCGPNGLIAPDFGLAPTEPSPPLPGDSAVGEIGSAVLEVGGIVGGFFPEPIEAAAPSLRDECFICGSFFAFEGTEKLSLRKAGRTRGGVELGMRMIEELFEIQDREGHMLLGSWVPAGRNGRKLAMELDPRFPVTTLVVPPLESVGVARDAIVETGPVQIRAKLRRDGTLALKLRFRFTALVDGELQKGRYQAKLDGFDITNR